MRKSLMHAYRRGIPSPTTTNAAPQSEPEPGRGSKAKAPGITSLPGEMMTIRNRRIADLGAQADGAPVRRWPGCDPQTVERDRRAQAEAAELIMKGHAGRPRMSTS